jgi:hypothetical protein
MAAKKADDGMNASHYMATGAVGPFVKGQVVSAEEVHATFGRNEKHDDATHEKYVQTNLKRLLDLGAITPAEAPEEDEESAEEKAEKASKAEVERIEADRKAFAAARLEQTQPPKSVKADEVPAAHERRSEPKK